MDLRLHPVLTKCKSSLSLFTIFIHKYFLLVVKSHTYVGVIVLLVLCDFLKEVLELYLWSTWADCVLVCRVLLVKMCGHIHVSDDFLRLEHRTCTLMFIKFKSRFRNATDLRFIPSVHDGAKSCINGCDTWTSELNFFRHTFFIRRLWIKTTVVFIFDRLKVCHSLVECSRLVIS